MAAEKNEISKPDSRPRRSQGDFLNLDGKLKVGVPEGWAVLNRVYRYTPENLYEIINGSAELYLSYEVLGLMYANLANEKDPDAYIELSVYDMGSPTNAFGIYSVEMAEEQVPVELGRAAYRSGSGLFVWHGSYYILVVSSKAGPAMEQTGLKLIRRLLDFLKDSNEPVWGLSALPEKDRVPNSMRFFRTDAMGLDFLKNTYTASYRTDREPVTAFLSRTDSERSARNILELYIEYARKYGKEIKRLTRNRTEFILCGIGDGFDVVFQSGRLMGGLVSVPDPDLALRQAVEFHGQIDVHRE
ncbi:MAG: hypothetical protein GY866_13325 [Proteobacteria bacterium]|nr:hypothetical protein [Pseudomonadota bacterium]